MGSGFANDECTRRTHVHDIKVAQFAGKKARAKCSVSADIHTSKENNEGHVKVYPRPTVTTGA